MVTDQNHSSGISNEQEVIRHTKNLARIFGLNEQNAYSKNKINQLPDHLTSLK